MIAVRVLLRMAGRRGGKYVAAAAICWGAITVMRRLRMNKLRAQWATAGKDVVVLHTLPRGNVCPSISPFALKLETFLRMTNIKYQIDNEVPMGPKAKLPWITVNGEDLTDSEFIVQSLQIKCNKFPDANLPKELRAVGLAFRVMLEEHFLGGLASWRFFEDNTDELSKIQEMSCLKKMLMKLFKIYVGKALYAQGIGRHTYEEIHSLMRKDLEALSFYLGEKDFLLGPTPQVADCAVFSFLALVQYNAPSSPYRRWINDDFSNLAAYTERMKQRFWPDWNQCVQKPGLVL